MSSLIYIRDAVDDSRRSQNNTFIRDLRYVARVQSLFIKLKSD